MPSDKKRINLTVPDDIYEKLQIYKDRNGITNDAGACLQLIIQQLRAQENTELVLKMMRNSSLDQLMEISKEGLSYLKEKSDGDAP